MKSFTNCILSYYDAMATTETFSRRLELSRRVFPLNFAERCVVVKLAG